MQLIGEKVVVRNSTKDECLLFHQWENQPYLLHLLSMEAPSSFEDTKEMFLRMAEDRTIKQMTILLRKTGQPIGRILLTGWDHRNHSVDFTRIYLGQEEFLSQGYGSEAMRLVINHLFHHCGLNRITIRLLLENTKAIHICQSAGFKREGLLRQAFFKQGKYEDIIFMALLKEEYRGIK